VSTQDIEFKTAKPRFINPPNKLKEKVGHGGIPSDLLTKGQEYIEKNPVDFEPYAEKFIKRIEKDLEKALELQKKDQQKAIDILSQPVMELKANGGMFQYQLISMIADVLLKFLDTVKTIDKDVIAIIKAHNNTLGIIINNKLKGDGGPEGAALTNELHSACQRYHKKHGTA